MKINDWLARMKYRAYARKMDRKLGGRSVEEHPDGRFRHLGANAPVSSDYRMLEHIFHELPVPENCTLIDVGCGQGRVLTYLLMEGFRGKLIGVDLDETVAEIARQRTQGYNVEIRCGNVLEDPSLFADADCLFLSNPFNGAFFLKFITLLESQYKKSVRMYYSTDCERFQMEGRPHWTVAARGWVNLPGMKGGKRPYSVYEYHPSGQDRPGETTN